VSEDVLKTYKFHVQIAEEDVRDGNANPWERVVTGLAAALRAERAGREEDKLCIEELADNLLNQLARVSELEAILSQETKRVAELEREKRLASDWECANCGRTNPGTMPYCPCREEHEQ